MVMIIHVGVKGSSKSGNYGHGGRPGKLGGSVPKSSGKLTTAEIGAIDSYSGTWGQVINQKLRDGSITDAKSKPFKDMVDNLDSAMQKNHTTQDMVLYRGVSFQLDAVKDTYKDEYTKPHTVPAQKDVYANATTLTDAGYTSTSTNRDSAEKFANPTGLSTYNKPPTYNSYIMELSVPKGTPSINMSKTGSFQQILVGHEQELLLPRGLKIVMHSVAEDKNYKPHADISANSKRYIIKASVVQESTKQIIIGIKGGAGSGNWAHGGRPGKEGGSAPGKGGGGVGPTATVKPGQPINVKFQPPEGTKLPEHQPGDESGLADYKAWYQAASAAGQTPSLQQAIQMRQYLAERAGTLEQQAGEAKQAAAEAAANTPEAKAAAEAAAEEEAKKKAELAKKIADKKKKGKGGAKKKAAAEKKPKGAAEKKPKAEKEPAWKKGLVEPPIMSGTKIPEAVYEEQGVQTYQKWLKDNATFAGKLTDSDKAEVYDYFTKRSAALAKHAKDAWARVYVPDPPFDMINAGVKPPQFDEKGKEIPHDQDQEVAIYNYVNSLSPAEKKQYAAWNAAYRNAIRQKALIPRTKPSPGTKEQKIIIHVGLKGSSTSGNYGHAGRPGKLGGSVPKVGGSASIVERSDVKLITVPGSDIEKMYESLSGEKIQHNPEKIGSRLNGFYHDGTIYINSELPVNGVAVFGKSSVHDTQQGTYNHEYAHHIWATKLTDSQKSAYDKAYSVAKPSYWGNQISTKAGRNPEELFAELYTAKMAGLDYSTVLSAVRKQSLPIIDKVMTLAATKQWQHKVKGNARSGNWGHRGIPGKIGGSQPKSAGQTSTDWEQRRQIKVTLANQKYPDGGFASGQAAQDWANTAYPGTEFDIASGGHTVINPTLKSYSEIAKKYPDVAKSIKQVSIGSTGMGSNPIIMSRDGSKVTLSNDWFTRNNAAELRDATREAVKAGFYPAGSGVGHYMTHAFGVRVMEHLSSNPSAGARMVEWLNGNFSKAKLISIYATTGKTEFFGELFSALQSGKSKAPLVNEFGQLLDNLSAIKSSKKV